MFLQQESFYLETDTDSSHPEIRKLFISLSRDLHFHGPPNIKSPPAVAVIEFISMDGYGGWMDEWAMLMNIPSRGSVGRPIG